MTSWRRATVALVPAIMGTIGVVSLATAQVCGDANGDGVVTVADGVNVLRTAAGLRATCSPATCDVDGSGSVTVADGVNVLRRAAGLSSIARCIVDVDPGDTEKITSALLPFIAFGFQGLTGGSSTSAGRAADGVDPCPDGGTRTTSGTLTRTVLLEDCQYSDAALGRFRFDGAIVIDLFSGLVEVEVDVRDLASDELVQFAGTIDGTPRSGGGFLLDDGPVTVHTAQGDFTFTFDRLIVDGDGRIRSGGGTAADGTPGSFDVETVEFEVESSSAARLVVHFDDGTTGHFRLDLETGDLTPA